MGGGGNNFVATICWEKKYSPANNSKWFSDNHDFILLYAKNKEIWRPILLERTEKANSKYKNPDNDPRGLWKTSDLSVMAENLKNIYEIITPSGRKVMPPKGRSWLFSKEKFEEYVKDKRIWFGVNGDNVPQTKRFLNEVKDGITPLTIWKYDECGHNQIGKQEIKALFGSDSSKAEFSSDEAEVFSSDFSSFGAKGEGSYLKGNDQALSEQSAKSTEKTTLFATPKPEALIKRIIEISTQENDLVMDFFAGSGTTLAVAHKMKRRWIGIEQMDYIESITKERLKKVVSGEQGGISKAVDWQGGGSFIYAELMPLNAIYKERIKNINDEKTLDSIYKDLEFKAFLDYRIDLDSILKDKEFKELDLEKKKEVLLNILDSNMDYVLYGDIEDEDYAISDETIELNRIFYGDCHDFANAKSRNDKKGK